MAAVTVNQADFSDQDAAKGLIAPLERTCYGVSQRTLVRELSFQGISVHSGEQARMRLQPAEANTGIVFITQSGVRIPAKIDCVVDNPHGLSTIIGSAGATISTIEHLMAAFACCGVDNAGVHLDGTELPIMDGSARPFVDEIQRHGLLEQNAERTFLRITKTLTVSGDEGQWWRFDPLGTACTGTLEVAVNYDSCIPVIGQQSLPVALTPQCLREELSASRTFGLESERLRFKELHKGLGASCENAVLYDGDRVINPEGLRYSDEAVRHKALDLIGDLYLAGWPLLGHISAFKPSHKGNAYALKELLQSDCFIL